MKIIKSLIAALALGIGGQGCALVALAQDTAPETIQDTKTRLIGFAQGVSAERNITVSLYPSYAPDLINKDGKSDQWGAGIALTYNPKGAVGQYTFTGLRVDYLGSQFWAPSVTGGLKADVQILGQNFTPFAYTGVITAISGAGESNGDFGMIVGGGAKTQVWAGKVAGLDGSLSVGVAAEKWVNFEGMVYHGGPVFKLSW